MRRPDWFDWTAGVLAVGLGLGFGAECWWRVGGYLANATRATGFHRLSLEYTIDGLTVLGTSLTVFALILHHREPAPSRARRAATVSLVSLKAGLLGLAVWFAARLAIFAATPLREFPLWTPWCHPCTYAMIGGVAARSLMGMGGLRRRRDWCERTAWWVGTFWVFVFGLKMARQFI